jgi:hypothetical protein
MRRIITIAVAALLAVSLFAAPSIGAGHEETPPHAHMLVQRPEFGVVMVDGEPWFGVTGIRRCVDLAAGRHLPLRAHHDTIHTGTAGLMLFEKAGHAVVPTFEYANCAELEAALPIAFFPLE